MKTYEELSRDKILTDMAIEQWKEYVYNTQVNTTIHQCVYCADYCFNCIRCPIREYTGGTCSPATPWLSTSIATRVSTRASKIADNKMLVLLYEIRVSIVHNLSRYNELYGSNQ